MALTEAQIALVEAFRKESDDKTTALVKDMFNIDYGSLDAIVGNNTITFSVPAYDDTDYVLHLSATDADGTDVTAELIINKQTTGMVINALTPCSIKWQTSRQTPKINFWT
jgi:hypothetical protein